MKHGMLVGMLAALLLWSGNLAWGQGAPAKKKPGKIDPQKVKALEAAVQKAEAAKKKAAEDTKQAVEAAEIAYKKAYAAYRKAISDGYAARRKADKEYRDARRALWGYKRGAGIRGPGPARIAKPKSPELTKLETAINDARKGIGAAIEAYRNAVKAHHDFRRKNLRSKDKAVKQKLKELGEAASKAREGISAANANWFKAVKARNAYVRNRPTEKKKTPNKPK